MKILLAQSGKPLFFIIYIFKNKLRSLSKFRSLNENIYPKLYPTPTIYKMLLKLEGFHDSLDLNIGCYHIQLNVDYTNFCTNIIPWGNTVTSIYQWKLATHHTIPS